VSVSWWLLSAFSYIELSKSKASPRQGLGRTNEFKASPRQGLGRTDEFKNNE